MTTQTAKIPAHVTWKTIAGQEVLFDKKKGDFFGLNETAALLLKNVIEVGVDATVEKMSAAFSVPKAELQADIKELLESLAKSNLIELSDKP